MSRDVTHDVFSICFGDGFETTPRAGIGNFIPVICRVGRMALSPDLEPVWLKRIWVEDHAPRHTNDRKQSPKMCFRYVLAMVSRSSPRVEIWEPRLAAA